MLLKQEQVHVRHDCPAHISVQGYIKLASQGRYREALNLSNMKIHSQQYVDVFVQENVNLLVLEVMLMKPIAIDEIKKFIAEQDLNIRTAVMYLNKRHEYGKKIAIVGGGPAGLSCAYYLAIDGYKVTVFEKQKALGGMLTLGIPSY